MIILKELCPHCGERSGFDIFAASKFRAERNAKEIKVARLNYSQSKALNSDFFAAGVCCLCGNPIILELAIHDFSLAPLLAHIGTADSLYNGPPPTIVRILPSPVPPYSHPALPERVNAAFVDLQKMLKQELSPHFIITGCRTVLESAVRELGGEGKKLHHRINDLKEKAIVNGVLAEWATHIRLEGNDAAHDMEGTPKEAAEIVEFTKLFLQYAFEFPARVKDARGQ